MAAFSTLRRVRLGWLRAASEPNPYYMRPGTISFSAGQVREGELDESIYRIDFGLGELPTKPVSDQSALRHDLYQV
jgi:hypothetical protein